jgi:hypothetical protein
MARNSTTMMLPDLVLLVGDLGTTISKFAMMVHNFGIRKTHISYNKKTPFEVNLVALLYFL